MSNLSKISEALQGINNGKFVTVKKNGYDDYKSFVVKLDPTNLTIVNVDDWGGESESDVN